jgi:hypothetical protein
MLGALLLHASAANAREEIGPPQAPGDQPAPGPTVEPIPPTSDAPTVSVPGSDPALEPLMRPAPAPAPTRARAPALSLPEPQMIHERRQGLEVAGAVIMIPAYLLQMVLSFGVTLSGIDGAPPGNYGQAGLLTLIPVLGPWLGPSSVGEPLPFQWALAWGGIEAAALAMIIAGEVGHDVPRESEGSKVSFAPFVTPEGDGLSLRMRW